MMKTRNRSGKVALWLAAGVVILLLLLPAGIIIGFTAQGYSCFAVATGSMHPTLPIGTLVVTREIPFDQMEEGQILTFRAANNPKKTFTHRAVEIDRENQLITTKGDANEVADPSPTEAQYCAGKVEYAFPLFGFVFLLVSTPAGLILLGLLALLWISFEVEAVIRKKRKEGNACAGD